MSDDSRSSRERDAFILSSASDVLEEAEKLGLSGNLWFWALVLRLTRGENLLGRLAERRQNGELGPDLLSMAEHELIEILDLLKRLQKNLRSEASLRHLSLMEAYRPSAHSPLPQRLVDALSSLVESLETNPASSFLAHLLNFYRGFGSGPFAFYNAFRWDGEALTPIAAPDPTRLSDLIGYEGQISELLSHVRLFLSGEAAANVLLFGDRGTGKSSSLKALLNEPEFTERGLRFVEVTRKDYPQLQEILTSLRGRNYKFALFLDDLSFDDFETEYKALKSVIEGGLERKPDNVVIYATSNLRHLVRERWQDRKTSPDDVHGSDTLQEKLSLVERFGASIWYGQPNKSGYMDIVQAKAKGYDLDLDPEALEVRALRWSIERGNFSGRAAEQLMEHLASEGLARRKAGA